MTHYIGEKYSYPNSKRKYILTEVRNNIYFFDCGHWCTDNVFIDLIRCKTNVQNYQNNQLTIF